MEPPHRRFQSEDALHRVAQAAPRGGPRAMTAGRRHGGERVHAMNQPQARAKVSHHLLRPVSARLPGHQVPALAHPPQERRQVPDLLRRGTERCRALENNDRGVQRAADFERRLPRARPGPAATPDPESVHAGRPSGPRMRLPGALRQVMLVESLPDQCLDDGLAAHVEFPGRPVQFPQQPRPPTGSPPAPPAPAGPLRMDRPARRPRSKTGLGSPFPSRSSCSVRSRTAPDSAWRGTP
jgi:hypothetical protein